MSAVQLHLLLNHTPLFGVLLGVVILLAGILLKNANVKNVAFCILVGAAVLVVPVYFSGDDAEDSLKPYGIGKDLVKPHDDAAKYATVAVLLTGVIAAVSLRKTIKGSSSANTYALVTLAIGLFASSTIIRTAYLGGKIRHPEIEGTIDRQKIAPF